MPKNSPPTPRLVKNEEPLVGPGAGRSAPALAVDCVDLRTARIATTRPTLFQPPLRPCMMGQIGLLVQKANLATLEAIKPRQNAEMRASKR